MTTRVMCLPYAGAGAGVYRPWLRYATEHLAAVPIQLPGREEEYNDPCYDTFPAAAAGTARRVRAAAGDEPFVLFGHSFGAILAFETAQVLLDDGGPLPRHLILSGSVSPYRRTPQRLSDDDEQAVAELRGQAGDLIAALEHPELRALLLPTMRADVRLLSDYTPATDRKLPIPITVLRGKQDDTVPPEQWLDWAERTSAAFDAIELPGGHLYLTGRWPEVWQTIQGLV